MLDTSDRAPEAGEHITAAQQQEVQKEEQGRGIDASVAADSAATVPERLLISDILALWSVCSLLLFCPVRLLCIQCVSPLLSGCRNKNKEGAGDLFVFCLFSRLRGCMYLPGPAVSQRSFVSCQRINHNSSLSQLLPYLFIV